MKRTALLIPCLIVLFGCNKPEETTSPVPAVPAQAEAPATAPEPIKKEAAGVGAEQAQSVAQSTAPIVAEQKPATPAVQPEVAAPVAPAPKAEVVAPPAEAKPLAAVSEAEALALAKKKNCFACHQIDRKVLGPSWKDVAAKYRGDAAAQVRMENKIAKGGSGAWGTLAMPAQPQLSEAERALLVRFILNLK